MMWETHHRRFSIRQAQPRHRCCIVVSLMVWSVLVISRISPGAGESISHRDGQGHDPCQLLLQQTAEHVRHILDVRLMWGFPVMAQIDEGNVRLSPLSIETLDCEQQRVVVSGSYEFRGYLGVIDITRRGTTVLQFHLRPKPGQRQVWLEAPEVLDVSFDNPAPWFDGKAIRTWALSLFSHPVCAAVADGQAC